MRINSGFFYSYFQLNSPSVSSLFKQTLKHIESFFPVINSSLRAASEPALLQPGFTSAAQPLRCAEDEEESGLLSGLCCAGGLFGLTPGSGSAWR